MTVVFDAGQNSEANFAHLAGAGLQYIGSVPASDCPDLTALPASVRTIVGKDRFGGLTAFDTRRTVYRAERRAILTHSPQLRNSHPRALHATTLSTARQNLDQLPAPHRHPRHPPRAPPPDRQRHAPPRPPGRPGPVRPRTARPACRHRRDRPHLPLRRRPAQSPPDAHRTHRQPAGTTRDLRTPALGTPPLGHRRSAAQRRLSPAETLPRST